MAILFSPSHSATALIALVGSRQTLRVHYKRATESIHAQRQTPQLPTFGNQIWTIGVEKRGISHANFGPLE
jgi:hypothetical protein